MATRRIVGSERTILEKDDNTEDKSNISPAVSQDVIYKLLAFTFAMIIVPIGSYFLTVNTIFRGNSSYAGGLAAVLANVVLIAYIIVAMNEDTSDKDDSSKSESKKQK
ncbi:vacuolar ATPase assembly integral membrane protein vma21 [Amphichorda felina]